MAWSKQNSSLFHFFAVVVPSATAIPLVATIASRQHSMRHLAKDMYLNNKEEVFYTLDLLSRLLSFNTAVCFAMMVISKSMQFHAIGPTNEQAEKNVWVVEMICNLVKNLPLNSYGDVLMSMGVKILENELKIKIAELNEAISNLRMTISSLEEKIAKEESYKLEAIECCRKEKEARNEAERMNVSLTTELEKVSNVKSAVEQKAIANEEMYKTSQEFNNRLLQHNSCLQPNLETTNEVHKRLETEKSSIVEHLSTVRGHKKALQEQLASLK
ncbi:kinesin protein KIN-14C [Trifolium repens]|nr:kinesin protein KIN-14C [Trifolium repens]